MQMVYSPKDIISLLDYTSLNDNDTSNSIAEFCSLASNKLGEVAAICIYPKFISTVKNFLQEKQLHNIKIATVINFPGGDNNITVTLKELEGAIQQGANEIDVVLPYKKLQLNDKVSIKYVENYLREIIKNCSVTSKVIIESGLLNPSLIKLASSLIISCGANFIKTSTGKTPISATLESAAIILQEIKTHNTDCGFKASGGIKTYTDALSYVELAETLLGRDFIKPQTFRIGASSIMNDLLNLK